MLLLQVTLNDGGLDKNQSKLKRKKYIYIYKFKTFKKNNGSVQQHSPAMKPSLCLLDF